MWERLHAARIVKGCNELVKKPESWRNHWLARSRRTKSKTIREEILPLQLFFRVVHQWGINYCWYSPNFRYHWISKLYQFLPRFIAIRFPSELAIIMVAVVQRAFVSHCRVGSCHHFSDEWFSKGNTMGLMQQERITVAVTSRSCRCSVVIMLHSLLQQTQRVLVTKHGRKRCTRDGAGQRFHHNLTSLEDGEINAENRSNFIHDPANVLFEFQIMNEKKMRQLQNCILRCISPRWKEWFWVSWRCFGLNPREFSTTARRCGKVCSAQVQSNSPG